MTQTKTPGETAGVVATGQSSHKSNEFRMLVLGALGVVYGDIGTSPIYAFRQALSVRPGGPQANFEAEVLGLLSLIIWALTITVTVKYIFFVTRADNKGEGGTLSLMSLAASSFAKAPGWIIAIGVVGAALFFGDAIITPAISVLSAVEGVTVVAPDLERWVVPVTFVIIIGVFMVQRFGTAGVSKVFGPVTAVWFLVMGVVGLSHIVVNPQVLLALNPAYGILFLATHPDLAALVLGAVFLAVTGVEGLYVDLGHFGRKPIVTAWFIMVFPCLLLNYFGQGAYVLSHEPGSVDHPFFEMVPAWGLIPMIGLATCATIIASQAVITGAYSLTQQAIALNLLPRMTVLHTSETQSGQIYMPQVNVFLMIFVLLLVVSFGSSGELSNAYGIAVSGVMLVTVVLLGIVMWRVWKWHPIATLMVMTPFLLIDLGFFAANVTKLFQGGWVPAAVAVVLATLMSTWMSGRRRLAEKTRREEVPLEFLVENLAKKRPTVVPGTAIFLTSDIEGAPTALLHSLKHYKVLHEQNVILTVLTSSAPRVPDDEKVLIDAYNDLFYRVIITFGYMETPNIPKALGLARKLGWKFDIMSTSFFLSRRSLKPSHKRGLIRYWQDKMFMRLARNATDATEYFHIPTGRVVEIGTQVIL
ncbi:KUP system potassium uptake protein [Devosia enhydra]|uniref:Probable potassium transport system protein Kup n=1 Tax=Devosia enhydra TaxID=665118 RepID=A0A1K2HVM6_9HYPH|nr:KUP system potassium uptake protein [Devosia enhydra]